MGSTTPRLDGINSEKIAEMASRYIREGDESSRTDFQAAAFTQATALSTLAMLAEVHHLRKEIGALRGLLESNTN